MGTVHARDFWLDGSDEHQSLAQSFEENIDVTHPSSVTGRSAGCGLCSHCSWCATKVVYPTYRGPRVSTL